MAWNAHEPEPGKFVFDENLDLEKYIQVAQDFDLNVILRPGPYVDAELDMVNLF